MDIIIPSITNAVINTIASLSHNWPYLIVSVIAAVVMKVISGPTKSIDVFCQIQKCGDCWCNRCSRSHSLLFLRDNRDSDRA